MFGVSKHFFIFIFIYKECLQSFKGDSKDIYVTKNATFLFQINAVILIFLFFK